jgi:hypothetical protein
MRQKFMAFGCVTQVAHFMEARKLRKRGKGGDNIHFPGPTSFN